MTLCQRTNAGVARQVARWLARHDAALLVDDQIPDTVRYQLVRAGDDIDASRHRFRTVGHFARAIETPRGLSWT